MSKQKENKQLKKILQDGLMKKAPTGMADRIMATIAVSPARRLSVTAVEPKPYIASLVLIFTGILVAVAAFIKPVSRLAFSIDWNISFNINPIWMAPVVALALTVWVYIIFIGDGNLET